MGHYISTIDRASCRSPQETCYELCGCMNTCSAACSAFALLPMKVHTIPSKYPSSCLTIGLGISEVNRPVRPGSLRTGTDGNDGSPRPSPVDIYPYYITHEGTVMEIYLAGGDSLRLQPNMASLRATNTPELASGSFGPTLREN
jgi:hypothetical protein